MKFFDLKTPKPFPTELSTQWDKSDHCAHSTEKKTYPALHFVNLTLISCLQPPTLCLEGTNLPQKIATDLSPILNDEKTPLVKERDKVTDEVSILFLKIFGKKKKISFSYIRFLLLSDFLKNSILVCKDLIETSQSRLFLFDFLVPSRLSK